MQFNKIQLVNDCLVDYSTKKVYGMGVPNCLVNTIY